MAGVRICWCFIFRNSLSKRMFDDLIAYGACYFTCDGGLWGVFECFFDHLKGLPKGPNDSPEKRFEKKRTLEMGYRTIKHTR